jgi:hypothetical protein
VPRSLVNKEITAGKTSCVLLDNEQHIAIFLQLFSVCGPRNYKRRVCERKSARDYGETLGGGGMKCAFCNPSTIADAVTA